MCSPLPIRYLKIHREACVRAVTCLCVYPCLFFMHMYIQSCVYNGGECWSEVLCSQPPPLSEDNLIVSYNLLHDIISLRSSLICSVCSNQSLAPPSQVSCKAAKNCPVLCSCTCFKDLRARAATETAM